MRIIATLVLLLSGLTLLHGGVKGKVVEYKADGVILKGYLAYDDSKKGQRPGVLVVHEWWGHNEYARKRARMLAELGYTALAVDMYGNAKQAKHPDDAMKFVQETISNMELAKAKFSAGMELLKNQKTTDPGKIAAIGYCFGGGVVLQMAREGFDLAGVVSFHGGLATQNPAQPGKVKAKMLVCNGADDSFVPAEQIQTFRDEMDSAKVDYQFINYAGAVHSFTNPDADKVGKKFNMALGYNAAADQKSWSDMKQFLETILRK